MICHRCGSDFHCKMTTGTRTCWCETFPVISNIPKQYNDCLCNECLEHFKNAVSLRDPSSGLVEGEDFYYDKKLFVFTEQYHLNKGACCGNGCVNCPY
ncbi:MAG: cysteine-rich CWC family protein [Pseudobdellovibrionaceae bacterium]